jgi:hypothetical protein
VRASVSKAPRRLLLNDEGSAAVHYLDLDTPARSWTFEGPGRDLQLIGDERVLRSTPCGFSELSLKDGRLLREVARPDWSGIESARRLRNGNTVVLGNGADGIFLREVDAHAEPIPGRALVGAGLAKGRLVRHTSSETLLFCSDTDGRRVIHEASWQGGIQELFRVPEGVPADSMLKAVRVSPSRLVVSAGYSASLLVIDTVRGEVVQTIGGKAQAEPAGLRRSLSPHFFSGFQLLPNAGFLIANWQGHGPSHAGDGYQLLMYEANGELVWTFDQTEYPFMTSLNNVMALDGLDTACLHDERSGLLAPVI